MPTLDIRRHAQRIDLADNQSALAPAAQQRCARLAKAAPKYALVVSSPLPRAKETAERIAGRLDAGEPGLIPDLGGFASSPFGELHTLADWARLLKEHPDASKFAEEQLPTWSRIAARVGDKDRVLAVSHGGIIGLPAILLIHKLGVKIEGPSFGYGDGVSVTYAKGQPTVVAVLRA